MQPFCNAVDVWKQWLSESQIDLQMSNFRGIILETSDSRPRKQTSDQPRSQITMGFASEPHFLCRLKSDEKITRLKRFGCGNSTLQPVKFDNLTRD